ncbi:uncharacterized protein LOC125832019 [Solanum verrucosum]|uniref:uncharacterized protein LOC125832019 n=1 Tax=Solanum verrucosum TaxID=315347 RepID=UPI0020D0072E|nr:uncharacterized protein LOC125832019 [Solanum verrucosum]
MVAEPRDEMSKFVTGMSSLVRKECCSAMLHDNMNISHFMVYAQQMESEKLLGNNREMKRARSDEQEQPRSQMRSSNQDSPMVNKDRASNPYSQGGNGGSSSFERSICAKCGNPHLGKCLAGMDGCFGYGKKGHNMRDCPTFMAKGREANQASLSVLDPNAPKHGHFYALRSREDKGAFPDEGIGMLIVS